MTVVAAAQREVEDRALALVREHAIRAMDAWHLAVAVLTLPVLAEPGEELGFASRDETPHDLEVGDINNDGKLDVAIEQGLFIQNSPTSWTPIAIARTGEGTAWATWTATAIWTWWRRGAAAPSAGMRTRCPAARSPAPGPAAL